MNPDEEFEPVCGRCGKAINPRAPKQKRIIGLCHFCSMVDPLCQKPKSAAERAAELALQAAWLEAHNGGKNEQA